MRPRTRYLLTTIVLAVVLFACWRFVVVRMAVPGVIGDAGFLLPGIAAVVAASTPWKRKLVVLAGLVGVFVLGDLAAMRLGIATAGPEGTSLGQSVVGQLLGAGYHVFRLATPIGAVLILARGDVTRLWAGEEPRPTRGVCPVCGKRKSGLEAHIRTVHGEKALRRVSGGGRLAR